MIAEQVRPGWRYQRRKIAQELHLIQDKMRAAVRPGAPWNVANTDVTLTLAGPAARKVTRLDENLYPTADKVEAKAGGGGVVITPPANAMYLLVE